MTLHGKGRTLRHIQPDSAAGGALVEPRVRCLGVAWLLAATATTALASSPTRVGGEFQVNSYTVGSQSDPAAALDAKGNFVIAWSSSQDGDGDGVFARRFDPAGAAQGAEFQVNSHTTSAEFGPVVAISDDLDFVVAWSSSAQDGSGSGVFARRFRTTTGAFLGVEFQVNTNTSLAQLEPTVAMDSNADFVIAWRDARVTNVIAQRFNSTGAAQGVELQVGSYDTGSPSSPAVGMSATGDFVVAWVTLGQDGPASFGVFARRFESDGAPQGVEFQVNVYTPGSQRAPAVDLGAHGDFVIAWLGDGGQDGDSSGVFARRFAANGGALGGELQVNAYTSGTQGSPAIGIEENGAFVIAWQSESQDGSEDGIFARRFSSTGSGLGREFQVNSRTSDFQRRPTVGTGGDGDLVIAWQSDGDADGADDGIFAQRFTTLVALDVDNNGVVDALTDGILLVRFAFGFTGASLTTGAVGPACTRCNSAAILAYLTGLESQLGVLGNEFQVNTYKSSIQYDPAVGTDADGGFVVAWSSYTEDGSNHGIFTRRFNSSGGSLGGAFRVNAYTPSTQRDPAVGMDADGDFVVAWASNGQDGSELGVFARRFDADDGALDGESPVNAFTSDNQQSPAVGMNGDGNFVVAWQSYAQDGSEIGVFARRFGAGGGALGAEFQVNVHTSGSQQSAAVGMDGDGDFVVAWGSFGQDGSVYGIFARRFNATGLGLGAEFQVNVYTSNHQTAPAIGMNSDGDFVVTWSSFSQDGSSYGIFGRRFNGAGGAVGAEFAVNAYTSGSQSSPTAGMHGDGDFVIAWQSNDQDGSSDGVFARRFDATGAKVGVEFQVNTYTTNLQRDPSVGINDDGDFVVAWESYGQEQVGSNFGVFAQRFATVSVVDVDGNGSFSALTDGLLVLRFLFGFTGPALVTGAVDLVGCTRCDAPAIQAYLQTLV